MQTIKLSEIPNLCNTVTTKSGEICSGIRILYKIKESSRGKKPTFYYQGKQVILDIKKEDIEEILLCDFCGWQTSDLTQHECPKHGDDLTITYRIKGTQHQVYEDRVWKTLKQDFKDKFVYLDRFKKEE